MFKYSKLSLYKIKKNIYSSVAFCRLLSALGGVKIVGEAADIVGDAADSIN